MAKKQIATFLGPNKGISIVGTHAYSYSGVVSVNDTEASLIETTTGKYYLVGQISFGYPDFSNDNFRYRIYMNGQQLWGIEVLSGADANLIDPIDIVVPPNTTIRITADNVSSGNAVNQVATMLGRVYDA